MLDKVQPDDDLVINLVEMTLAQPEQEREVYLRGACGESRELFEQVWHYVQWEHQMGGFLLEPLCTPLAEERGFEPGTLLENRFRILREVARGGMGIVYEALDEKLDRRIAIKCAKCGFHKRLPPEVRHASEISHPNVCKIYEIHTARTSSGEVDFVTMEYLDGETLAQRIQRGPLPMAEAQFIGRQLCTGLGAAHGKGVIHGDLKSSNVILTRTTDGARRAVITDFGMARARESTLPSAQTGLRGGTPDYMAPELLKGERATFASDVYALGILLRELSYRNRKPRETSVSAFPKSIFERCLSDDPRDRYQSATEVAQALEPSQTRRRVLIGLAAGLVAVFTGIVTYQRATPPKEAIRLAIVPFTYSAELAPAADGIFQQTSANLARLKGGTRVQYSLVPLKEARHAGVGSLEAGSILGATHVLHAGLTKEKDQVLLHALLTDARTGNNLKEWKMNYAPSQVRYVPVALAGFVTGSLHLPPLEISAMNAQAEADYRLGSEFLKRESTINESLSAFDRARVADPDSALIYAGLAEAQWIKWGLGHGNEWISGAAESTRQAQRRNPDLPRVLYVAGTTDFVNSLYELAAAEYQRALEIDPNYSDVYRFLGRVYELSGQTDKALAAFRQAVQIAPGDYRTHIFLGWFYTDLDQYTQALAPLRQAVLLAPSEPGAREKLAFAYKGLGQFGASETELRTALKFGETAMVLDQLGETLMYERLDTDSIPLFQRALAIDPQDQFALMELGICYRRLERRQEAAQINRRGQKAAEAAKLLNPRSGLTHGYLAYFDAELARWEVDGAKDREAAASEVSQAITFSPDGVEVRWLATLAYEALGKREDALSVLSAASPELLGDLNRWPDLAGLQKDPTFMKLLVSNHVQ